MSHDVHTNHFTSSEDPQPRAEDSRADVTMPPMPDRAPTGAPTLNLEKQSVETPNADELRDMVHPDRKRSMIETVLNTRLKRWGAGVLLAATVVVGGGVTASAIYNAGKSAGSEQPAGDNHAGGDILNQQNGTQHETQAAFVRLESGKTVDQQHYKFIIGGEAMTYDEAVQAFRLKRDILMTDEEFVANWAKSLELRLNSASTDEEYTEYKDYRTLPPEKDNGKVPTGLPQVYNATYRNVAQKANKFTGDGTQDPDTGNAYDGAYKFFDTDIDSLAMKQMADYADAKKAGKTTLPHMKVTVLSAQRSTADEAANAKNAPRRADDHVYKIKFVVDNGVGSTALIEQATFQFRPLQDGDQAIWGYRDVRYATKSAIQRTAVPTAPATLAVTK